MGKPTGFMEHDRQLHGSASRMAEALRAGRRDEALTLGREMVATCQTCHAEAPAADGVDLSAITLISDTLAPEGGTP